MLRLISRYRRAFFGAVALCLVVALASQRGAAQSANATPLLNQLSAAFSGGQAIQQIQLAGNATLYAGSLEDSGTVTLSASTNGSSEMQMRLMTAGSKTESQSGIGTSASCQWSGADGVIHRSVLENCARPLLWFLPAISLQPPLIMSGVTAADLGSEPVGNGTTNLRHLRTQLSFSGPPPSEITSLTEFSSEDLGLDPTTLLPSVLSFIVQPDVNIPSHVSIEIHYSQYQNVNGVQIPFHIQRFVNGSLQLDVLVNSVHIN